MKIGNKVFAKKQRQPTNENCIVNREFKKSKKQYYAEYFSVYLNNIKKPGMALGKL